MIQKIKLSDKEYPFLLKNIFDPPKKLYVLGHAELVSVSKMIAIVGTRRITTFGQKITSKLTKELVEIGYIIVSGMALGVDGVAHTTAIAVGGKTVAVLGAGVDIIYPPQHQILYSQIISSGGAIISEIPPGQFVPRNKFAARNRIISGLCEAVLVTEAEIKSGSLITAKLALEQGRDVFAVPGSAGTNYLIDQGATPVKDVSDILSELNL